MEIREIMNEYCIISALLIYFTDNRARFYRAAQLVLCSLSYRLSLQLGLVF